jgi:hypothetical protein
MRELTFDEVLLVAGGLTDKDKSWTKWIESLATSIYNAIFGDHSSGTSAPPPQISDAALGQMQRDCINAGGDFSYTQTTSSGSATFEVVSVSGSTSYVSVTCTKPQ